MLRNLRTQILLWTILPLVILLIAFSVTGIRNHRDSMRALVAERNAALTKTKADEIEAILAGYTTSFELLAASEAMRHGDGQAIESLLEEASQFIDAQLLVVPAGHDIDAKGEILAGASVPWALEALSRVLSEAVRPPVTVLQSERIAFWGIPIAERDAWLLAGVPIARLRGPLSGEAPGTYMLLTDTLGSNFVDGPLPADMEGLDLENSGVFFASESEMEFVIAYAPISGTDWILIMREPWEPLVAPLLRFEGVIPFVLLSAGLVSLLTLFFGLRYLVQPLGALRHQAERIGAGDFEAASHPVGGVTEIEELHDTLNRMARQIQRYQQALKGYLGAITSVQEEERARLARELHDGTVQMLIALNQRAQMVQRGLSRHPASREQHLQRLAELRTMISDGIEEVRRFSRALRPLYLEELGLAPAVEMLARSANATYRLVGTPKRIGDEKEVALYRMTGEALSNARRHSQAEHIAISLTFAERGVRLQVSDDGDGFEVPTDFVDLARAGHFGLMGMHERAHFVGAQLHIHSVPGEGTTVTVTL